MVQGFEEFFPRVLRFRGFVIVLELDQYALADSPSQNPVFFLLLSTV